MTLRSGGRCGGNSCYRVISVFSLSVVSMMTMILLRLTNANEVKPNETLQLRVAVCNIQISSSVSCLYHTPTGRRSLLAAGGHRERLPGQNMAHQEQGTSLCFMASLFYHLFLRIVLI